MNGEMGLRVIPGFSSYAVTADGSVYSRRPMGRPPKAGLTLLPVWRKLTPALRDDGYLSLGLRDDAGRFRTLGVHSLVLLAFVGPRPEGKEACHRNGDKGDNRLENLRWDTPKANAADKEALGRTVRGERQPRARLSEADVQEVRRLASEGWSQRKIARRFGIAQCTAGRVIRGLTWHHVEPTY